MNVIPAALRKRPPAAVLAETKTALTAAQEALAALEAQRKTLLEADTSDGLLAIDRQINEKHSLIFVLTDRAKIFEQRAAEREAEKKKAGYDKAVNAIAGRALGLTGGVQELAAAIEAVAVKFEQLVIGQRSVLRDWPTDHVELPFASQLGLAGAEAAIAEAFGVFDRAKFGRWPDWTLEKKLAHVREIAADFRKTETHGYDALVADLRNGSPKLAEPEPTDEVAA